MPRRNAWLLLALGAGAACAPGVASGQATTTAPPAPPVTSAPPPPPATAWHTLEPADAGLAPAVRVAVTVQVAEPPPQIPLDPLEGYYGTFVCRFATAGRVTPCCPDAVPVLALFWSGRELAIADFIAGREGGCDEAVVNSIGCKGWFQLCPPIGCPNGCLNGYGNAERARQLFDARGWQPWCFDGRDVTGRC